MEKNILRNIPIFSSLEDFQIDYLSSIGSVESYKKKDTVFHQNDSPVYIHLLIEGVIKIVRYKTKGEPLTLQCFTPYSFFGDYANYRNIPFPSSAEFITDGKIVKFKYKEYSHFFLGDDNQNNFIFESLLNKIEGLQNTINRGLILDTLSRVSKFIFEYKEAYKYLKQYEIASMLSITPETLSRTLKKLVEKDLIILEKGKIKIKNLEGLKKLF